MTQTVVMFGTFDLFHVGHLRILQRARSMGDRLVVGVSSDEFNFEKKSRLPMTLCKDRLAILSALECVDEVFVEESMEKKTEYVQDYGADIVVMGDDWKGAFDYLPCQVVYLERTPGVSTTSIIEKINAPGGT